MSKRNIKEGDIFWHKNKSWQRKVLEVSDGYVYYHDGFGYGSCSIAHFFSVCPKEVVITKKDLDIANSLKKDFSYCISLLAVNAKYDF